MKRRIVTVNDEPIVDWTTDPVFRFKSEVDALTMLQILGNELESAREQVRHTMRYMAAAVRAARQVEEDGRLVSKQAIIHHSGLSRQTVYGILTEESVAEIRKAGEHLVRLTKETVSALEQ